MKKILPCIYIMPNKKSNLKLYDGNDTNPIVFSHSSNGTTISSEKDDGSGPLPIIFTQPIKISQGPHNFSDFIADYAHLRNLQTSNHTTQSELITGLQEDLGKEVARATGSESVINAALSAEQIRATKAEALNSSAIVQEVTDREAAVIAEANTRAAADRAEKKARTEADSALQIAIDTEAEARAAAVNALQSQISNLISNTETAALDSLSEIVSSLNEQGGSLTDLIASLDNRIKTLEDTLKNHFYDDA